MSQLSDVAKLGADNITAIDETESDIATNAADMANNVTDMANNVPDISNPSDLFMPSTPISSVPTTEDLDENTMQGYFKRTNDSCAAASRNYSVDIVGYTLHA